jgi:two-component system, OmpR family, sensor kinase
VASGPGGRGRSSVRRHLFVLVAANLVVVVVVGIGGIIAAVRSHESVHYLTGRVGPAASTNAATLQELTDAETYIWGWAISGDSVLLTNYREAVERYKVDRERLSAMSDLDPEVGLLVGDYRLAADSWFSAYVQKRLTQPTGLARFDAALFDRGIRLFDDVRSGNAAVAERLRELNREAAETADDRVRRIIAILVAVLLVCSATSLFGGRFVRRRVTEPLSELERTAERLAVGEHTARASGEGPREVVQVARAINKMADENDRARAVEARVVEQLRALDAVKSDFVSNVSHELRTPLTSILGYLELLEEEIGDHPEGAESDMVAAAKRNVIRLGELIDDLLALTRSEAQRTVLAPLDLAQLVRDVVTDLRVASGQHGVEIRLGLPDSPVPVLADAGQIARVVTNLVSNAVKFSQGGSEIVVTVITDGNDAVLSVEDHGIGIPEAELDQLGSRFYRASNAVGLGITGTGLGLRIVQAIVENHRGSVDLRSTQGMGTTVRVRLPVAVAAGAVG